jgi:hypothetical protein
MRVSGRYRTAVVAMTHLYDGTEITVGYGAGVSQGLLVWRR